MNRRRRNRCSRLWTKNYEADLLAAGVPEERIYKLGLHLLGKMCLLSQIKNEQNHAFSIDLIVAASFIIGENKADRRSLG